MSEKVTQQFPNDKTSEPTIVPRGPDWVTMVIETRCNLHCRMCIYHSRHTKWPAMRWSLGYDDYVRLTDILVENGLKHMHLCAVGEPFLNRDIFRMIRYGSERGLPCSVLTNASGVVTPHLDEILDSELDYFQTDLDSGDPAQYEHIKDGAKWDVVVSNLKTLAEGRARRKKPLRLGVWCIVMRSNYTTFGDLVRICADIGVDDLNYSYLVPVDFCEEMSTANVIDPNDAEIRRAIEASRARGEKLGVRVVALPLSREDRQECRCKAPWTKLMINLPSPRLPVQDWLGNASLHCSLAIYGNGHTFGNILKQPFQEVWNGKLIRNIRQGLLSDPPEICLNCPVF